VAGISSFGSNPGVALGPLTTNADKLLRQVASKATENSKIDKSSKDFESILLGSWLQQAEQSFGSLPGEDAEDSDTGKEQFQGIAMQSLGASLTSSGGIGIAKMIAKSLHKAEDARVDLAAKTSPVPNK
jgi:Rod binding domain-containing protein